MALEIPVDQSRFAALMVSAGSTVEAILRFDKDAPKDAPKVQDVDKVNGQPLWRCTVFLPGEDGGRPEMIAVKVASPVEPKMPAFGAVVEFENLTAVPWIDGTRVKLSFKSTGLSPFVTGRKGEAA